MNPLHEYVEKMVALRYIRLTEQAEIFLRMGYTVDELVIVSRDDAPDEVMPKQE